MNSMSSHEWHGNQHPVHDEVERLRNKVAMLEACLAGNDALITGLKDEIKELERVTEQRDALHEAARGVLRYYGVNMKQFLLYIGMLSELTYKITLEKQGVNDEH